MADIKVSVEFTCGLHAELGRKDGNVTVHLPVKRFKIEPPKAMLISKLMAALAEYPETNRAPSE